MKLIPNDYNEIEMERREKKIRYWNGSSNEMSEVKEDDGGETAQATHS